MLFEYEILTYNINSLGEFYEEYERMFEDILEILWDSEYSPRLEEDYEEALLHTEYYPDYRVDTAMAIHTDNYRQEACQQVKWILAKWEDRLTAGRSDRILRYRKRKNALAGRY